MTDEPPIASPPGPVLLCAGTDPAAAARLAEAAVSLLTDRRAVVLATWQQPPIQGGLDAVTDALYDTHADLRRAARRAATEVAHAACDVLDAHGFEVTPHVCGQDLLPWPAILEVADEIDAGVIVAGTSEGSTPHPGALGRQARALAHRAHRPLLLLPADAAPAAAEAPAIFAYDGSAPAGHALRTATWLLRPRPAIVASVWQTASYAVGVALLAVPDAVARKGAEGLDEQSCQKAEREASDGQAVLSADGWPCQSAALETSRSVPTAIIASADEHDAAIVVTGTRGRSGIAAALLGSTAEAILRHAGRPVLLVPPAQHSQDAHKDPAEEAA